MRLMSKMSLRWRLLAGFLLAAFMTVLSGVSGIISLGRIQTHMFQTATGVHHSVRQQTEQTNSAIHLRDVIDGINSAATDYELTQIEQVTLQSKPVDTKEGRQESDQVKKLLASKRQQLVAIKTLKEMDKALAVRLDEVNTKIADIVDSVTFEVLLGIEDVTASAAADANAPDSNQRLASFVDTGLTKIKSALTARASLLELNLAFQQTLLSQDADMPKSCAVIAENLYTNMEHQLAPLHEEDDMDRIEALIDEIKGLTPQFLEAKTGQILSASDFESVFQTVMGNVRQRSLTVVANAKTLETDVGSQFEGSRRFTRKSRAVLIGISLVSFLQSIFIGIHMARSFGTSINTVVTQVRNVADGDLTQNVIETGNANDEIGLLASHFNGMVKNLKEILGSTQEVAGQINATGQEILTISEAQATGAREQSCAVSETSSAAAELSKTSEQIGENIKTISQMANHVLAGMENIKEATDQTNRILTTASAEGGPPGALSMRMLRKS